MIATDNDREGENIGFEVIEECLKSNSRLTVKRMLFTAVTNQEVQRALENLSQPDKRKSDACNARSELDLRIGATFTRFQTLRLQSLYPVTLDKKIVSYGGCQFPTLGFVVDQFKKHEDFMSEDFWKIDVKHHMPASGPDQPALKTSFTWDRNRLFDEDLVRPPSSRAAACSSQQRPHSSLFVCMLQQWRLKVFFSTRFRVRFSVIPTPPLPRLDSPAAFLLRVR